MLGSFIGVRVRKRRLSQLITYLPSAADTWVGLDVAALRRAGLMQLLDSVPVSEEAEYQSFVKQTGFRYETDLDQAVLLVQPARTLGVLEGRFDWKKLTQAAQQQGGRCDADYCRVPSARPGKTISFRRINPHVLGIASAPDPDAARLIGPSAHGVVPADLPTQPLWISLPPTAFLGEDTLPAGTRLFARVLAHTQRVLFTIGQEQSRYAVGMDVRCMNAHDAQIITEELQKITQTLNSFISREKQTPNPNDLSGVLSAGTFQQKETEVVGHWPVEPGFFKTVASTGGSH